MIKIKYFDKEECGVGVATLYVGRPKEIKALYGSIYRAWKHENKNVPFHFWHTEKARFSPYRLYYGLDIDGEYNVSVLTEDIITHILLEIDTEIVSRENVGYMGYERAI